VIGVTRIYYLSFFEVSTKAAAVHLFQPASQPANLKLEKMQPADQKQSKKMNPNMRKRGKGKGTDRQEALFFALCGTTAVHSRLTPSF
jgi:hypothetical protein